MFKDRNRHYSLRKLSIGLASVLIGISFASSMTGSSVKADIVNGSNNDAQTVVKGNEATIKADAKAAPEGQSQTPEAVKKDSGAITQDIKQDAVNTEAKQQNTTSQGSDVAGDKALKINNSSVVQEDSSVKGDSLANKSNSLKAKTETTKKAVALVLHSETTLNLKGTNVIYPETLKEDKTEAVVKADSARGIDPVKFASNGGFDPEIWGTMDTSKWQLDNDGNITGYTGDMSHIIIPNSADFVKVGKSYSQIGISSDEMKKFGNNAHTDAASTLAISLTNDKKVKATNADWRDAFAWPKLRQANLEGLDTSMVTDMNHMFYYAEHVTNLDVSKWNTSNVTNMSSMFSNASNLTSLDVSNWNTSKVTDMGDMFDGAYSLTNLDVSKWNTSNVVNMASMFSYASSLTSLDVSNWNTSNVTDMSGMFRRASSLTNLDVSNWNTSNVTDMSSMFWRASSLALIVKRGKFANYLVNHDSFAESRINLSVKSVTTDNTKLLQLLTNDSQHDSATRTIVFTFPANYSPDLIKYHLIKNGNTYQIKQSADYAKSYAQGTVLINATEDITKHHIDTTKQYTLSDTWQPNYDKLVLAHKNVDGTVSFDDIQLPQIPGYKTVASLVNPARALFAVSFIVLPKPIAPAINDAKPAETVSPATPATEAAELIKTEAKAATSAAKVIDLSNDAVAITLKTIDLSDDAVVTTPEETTWKVANEPDQDIYQVSNGKYTVELPHISNAQLHVIANDSTKDSVLFTYKGQNTKYAFKLKFANGHYLLTTYEIKSGKLVKLIDYNFVKSSKMIDVILDWLKLN